MAERIRNAYNIVAEVHDVIGFYGFWFITTTIATLMRNRDLKARCD